MRLTQYLGAALLSVLAIAVPVVVPIAIVTWFITVRDDRQRQARLQRCIDARRRQAQREYERAIRYFR